MLGKQDGIGKTHVTGTGDGNFHDLNVGVLKKILERIIRGTKEILVANMLRTCCISYIDGYSRVWLSGIFHAFDRVFPILVSAPATQAVNLVSSGIFNIPLAIVPCSG